MAVITSKYRSLISGGSEADDSSSSCLKYGCVVRGYRLGIWYLLRVLLDHCSICVLDLFLRLQLGSVCLSLNLEGSESVYSGCVFIFRSVSVPVLAFVVILVLWWNDGYQFIWASDTTTDNYTSIALMNVIPDSYSDVKSVIKYGRDSASVDVIVSALKSKELDLLENEGSNSHEKAMNVRGRTKNTSSDNSEHGGKKKKDKSRSKSRKGSRKCYNRYESGHCAKECPKPKRNNKNNNSNESNMTNVATGDKLGDCYIVTDSNSLSINSVNSVSDSMSEFEWLLYSGCTYHITPFKNLFYTFKQVENDFVYMANEKKCKVVGIGDVCLKIENGFAITLRNVRYVPDLCYKFLSRAALEESGLEGRWENGQMKILKGYLKCVFPMKVHLTHLRDE
ncbi:hypothetical protein C2S52_016103 [Perilla frutescens var. hirtella]|nr:hypothetical protein C2S52_016103 [Perilla frutescens var. hirtella]